jgi:hypothetical protein
MREFDFSERLAFSEGNSGARSIAEILVSAIPGALSAHRAHKENDRLGIDWFVEMPNGKLLSVDTKVRSDDWAIRGKDDLALEIWSVCGKKIGWTLDNSKATDYVFWLWTSTGRWALLPFPLLCGAAMANMGAWQSAYPCFRQSSGTWTSECVFVPRKEVWAAIYKLYGGQPCGPSTGGQQ